MTGAHAVTAAHWLPPDAAGDILRQAWRPDVAAPREIRVRPELHARLAAQAREQAARDAGYLRPAGIAGLVPIVIDDQLPTYPGFEIYRERP